MGDVERRVQTCEEKCQKYKRNSKDDPFMSCSIYRSNQAATSRSPNIDPAIFSSKIQQKTKTTTTTESWILQEPATLHYDNLENEAVYINSCKHNITFYSKGDQGVNMMQKETLYSVMHESFQSQQIRAWRGCSLSCTDLLTAWLQSLLVLEPQVLQKWLCEGEKTLWPYWFELKCAIKNCEWEKYWVNIKKDYYKVGVFYLDV